MELILELNPSVWAFIGIIGAAMLSYLSTRSKYKNEGASSLVEAGVSLMEQYRLANEECQEELEECQNRLESANLK